MRSWIHWLLVLTLISLSAGCAKPPAKSQSTAPEQPASQPSVTTIRFLQAGHNAYMETVVSAYMEKYPGDRVEMTYLEPEIVDSMGAVKAKVEAGKVDVVPVIFPTEEMVQQQLILTLDPYVKAGNYDLKPYGPGLDQLRQNGALYELPVRLQPALLIYNRDLFQAAGVPEPTKGWTWDQFREAAGRLAHGGGDDRIWGFRSRDAMNFATARVFQGSDGVPDPARVQETLQFFGTMVSLDHSMKEPPFIGPGTRTEDEDLRKFGLFEDGKAAMGYESIFYLRMKGYRFPFQWDVAPNPAFPGTVPFYEVSPESYGIAATTGNPEAAWRFLTFLTGAEGAAILARAGELPGYNSEAIKRAWFEPTPAPPPGTSLLFETPWSVPTDAPTSARAQVHRLVRDALQWSLTGQRSLDWAFQNYLDGYQKVMAERSK